jgi:hypothetical protein
MLKRRRRSSKPEVEDVTGFAGWMYSDLLLGLTVIFLATISFIPKDIVFSSKPGSYVFTRAHPVAFTKEYEILDIVRLSRDVRDFKVDQQLGELAYISDARFVGIYDPREEVASTGSQRAINFSIRLDQLDPSFLTRAKTDFQAAGSVDKQGVIVEFKFATEVTALPITGG